MTRIKIIDNLQDGIPVQWVGVYVLKWQMEWGVPSVGFVEEDDPKDALIAEMLEALKDARQFIEMYCKATNYEPTQIPTYNLLCAIIAKAEAQP